MDDYGYPRPHPWGYGRGLGGRRGIYSDGFEGIGGWPSRFPEDAWDGYSLDGRESYGGDMEDDDDMAHYSRYRDPYTRRRRRYGGRVKYYPMDDIHVPAYYGPEDEYYARPPRVVMDDSCVNYGPPFVDPVSPSIYEGSRYRHPRGPWRRPPGPPDYDVYHHHHHDHVHFHEHNHKHRHGHRHQHQHNYPYGLLNMLNLVMPQGYIPGPGMRYPYATPMGPPLDAAYGYRGLPMNMMPYGPYGPPLPYPMRRGRLAHGH